MSLSELTARIRESPPAVLSSDLFDTVLLRDGSTEAQRLAVAAHRAAPRLGVDPRALTRLRWTFHGCAYRAVAMRAPESDASLAAICAAVAESLGLPGDAADVLRETEVDVDVEHLRPNRPLLAVLREAATAGVRVIAVSDMYYSGADLDRIVRAVTGGQPFAAVHASSDHGRTKHSGALYPWIAGIEGVDPVAVLHVGDNHTVDVDRAVAAKWTALHLPRSRRHRVVRALGKVRALPAGMRRQR